MADRHEPTPEQVRDSVADCEHTIWMRHTDELHPVDVYTIVEHILGYDPIDNKLIRPGHHGHVGKDAQVNKVLSMSTLRKVLDQLVEEGVLAKVSKPTWRQDQLATAKRLTGAVRFYYRKAGYVTTEALDEAYARLDASLRNKQRAKFRKAARDEIADKYAKQVETAYRRMCRHAGLDPVVEQTDNPQDSDDI